MGPVAGLVAHGGRTEIEPLVPLPVLLWGLAIIVAATFAALSRWWTVARLGPAASGRDIGPVPSFIATALEATGLALLVLAVVAGWIGENVVVRNILPVTLYVTVWIGGMLAAALVGDVWAAVNPVTTIARFADRGATPDSHTADSVGPEWGHWPATVGLVVFLFYELSHPTGSEPRTLAVLVTTHLIAIVVAARLWGWRWARDHEPFTVFFATVAAMAPLFVDNGRLRVRPPFAGLATLPVRAGTSALLVTVIGGTLFDGLSERPPARDLFADLGGWVFSLTELAVMLATILAAASLFLFGAWWAGRVTGAGVGAARTWLAPSLVPIAVADTVAHYLQLFADNIQAFVFRLADPFGWGWNLGGLSDNLIWQLDPTVTAWAQLAILLIGHAAAAVVAHDLAVARHPGPLAVRSVLAMVFTIIALGSLACWLLPAG